MPTIIEEFIPFDSKQLNDAVEQLTQIYALVLGWETKSSYKLKQGANPK